MDRSISFTKDNARRKRNLKHNNRLYDNEKHIDKKLSENNSLYARNANGELVRYRATAENYAVVGADDYEKNTIDKLFSERVNEYNAAQKGNRRRIKNGMYEELNKTVGKRGGHNLEREFIFGVGSKEDFVGMSENEIEKEVALREKVLNRAMAGFEERYPCLKLTQAHVHCDERVENKKKPYLQYVNPHAHVDFVPFPDAGYSEKTGKPKKPSASMNKALLQMFPNPENDSDKAFDDFTEDFRQYMDGLILEEDATYKRKSVGTHSYKSVADYKKEKEIETRIAALDQRESSIAKQENEIDKEKSVLSYRKKKLDERETSLNARESDLNVKLDDLAYRQDKLSNHECAVSIRKKQVDEKEELLSKAQAELQKKLRRVDVIKKSLSDVVMNSKMPNKLKKVLLDYMNGSEKGDLVDIASSSLRPTNQQIVEIQDDLEF